MIRAAVSEAKGIGCRRMRLDALPAMQEAIALYRSLGFREIGPYRRNPIPGAMYFELSLQAVGFFPLTNPFE